MLHAFLLIVDDNVLAPHLALARHICQPGNHFKPHITVRYPVQTPLDHRTAHLYSNQRIDSIKVVGPGAFGLTDDLTERTRSRSVVYLECELPDLQWLAYKPDFPDSVFHFTIYEGSDRGFALDLLQHLGKYNWGGHVRLDQPASLNLVPLLRPKPAHSDWHTSATYLARAIDIISSDDSGDLDDTLSYLRAHLDSLKVAPTATRLSMATKVMSSLSTHVSSGQYTLDLPSIVYSRALSADATGSLLESSGIGDLSTVQRSSSTVYSSFLDSVTHRPMPPELADEIVSLSLDYWRSTFDEGEIRFGTMLSKNRPLILALKQQLAKSDGPKLASIIGYEEDLTGLHPLNSEASTYSQYSIPIDFPVDSVPRDVACNLIICNAVDSLINHGISKVTRQEKRRLRRAVKSALGIEVSDDCEWRYVYLLLLAHRWMSPDAIAVWILPPGVIASAYGAAVRRYLGSYVELLSIHNYCRDPLQDGTNDNLYSVVFLRNREPEADHDVKWTRGRRIGDSLTGTVELGRDSYGLEELRNSTTWCAVHRGGPIRPDESLTIGDLFYVRPGVRNVVDVPEDIEDLVLEKLAEVGSRAYKTMPRIDQIRNAFGDVRVIDDSMLLSVPQRTVLVPSCFTHEELDVVFGRARMSAKSGVVRMQLFQMESSLRSVLIEMDRELFPDRGYQGPPIILSRWRRRYRGSRVQFTRNRSSHVVLNRDYVRLYGKPWTMRTILESGLSVDDIVALLGRLEKEGLWSGRCVDFGTCCHLDSKRVAGIRVPNGEMFSRIQTLLHEAG